VRVKANPRDRDREVDRSQTHFLSIVDLVKLVIKEYCDYFSLVEVVPMTRACAAMSQIACRKEAFLRLIMFRIDIANCER